MDGQKRPTSLYFSEKIIRLASSAAICGLTASFLLGEAVDARSGFFHNWIPISNVLPTEYPVIAPGVAFVGQLEHGDWAYKPQAAEEDVSLDQIQLAEARLPQIVDDSPTQEKVQGLMNSVTRTEAHIVQDKIKSVAAAPVESADQRRAYGTIRVNGFVASLGHFEVVAHDAVDAAGRPVGFPIAQKILKNNETAYSLDLSGNTKDEYLFLKYFSGDGDDSPRIFPYANNPIKPNSNPPYDFYVSALDEKQQDNTQDKSIAITGRVGAMFSGNGFVPLADALVKVRGSTFAASTNTEGDFSLVLPDFTGEVTLEVTRKDFFPTILTLDRKKVSDRLSLELASHEIIDKMATLLGIRQVRSKAILIGQSVAGAGMAASITNESQGPFYFSSQGYPVGKDAQKATAENGRFIFFNVEPGVGYLDLHVKGDPVAPTLISPVEGGGVIYKQLKVVEGKIRGRVFDPIAGTNAKKALRPVVGARIRVEGSSEWAVSDSIGAFQLPQFKYVQGEALAIELTAEKFYTHRFVMTPKFRESQKGTVVDVNLFAFPSAYINDLANSLELSLDPYSGLILGNVGAGRSLRIDALADHSPTNGSKDFYFDERGGLRGGRSGTHPDFGTFAIFNVPRGRILLQGTDRSGKARHYSTVYASPSVISIAVDQ